MSFSRLAGERALETVNPYLGELHWEVAPDGALQRPAPSNVEGTLGLLARRSLEPALVERLLDAFPDRPLERALLAWDIARGSLLGRSDVKLLARLSTEVAPLKAIVAAPGSVAIPRYRIRALVDASRPSAAKAALDDFERMPSLAGLVAMSATFSTLDDKPAVVARMLDYAKRLSFAHLPSLALAFLQLLWDRFQVPWALDLMIEIALDFGKLDAVPHLDPRDVHTAQQKAYGLLRAYLAMGDIPGASSLNASLAKDPATRDSLDPALLIARAELALREHKQFDAAAIELVNALVPPESGWRYGVTVRDALTLQTKPESAPLVLAGFIARFGNDAKVWWRAAEHPPGRGELLKRLSREIRYLSHDPEVWRALAAFSTEPDAIYAEVARRVRSQFDAIFSA